MNSPIRLILKWAGPDRKYLIAAVVFAFVSGLMAMVPYYGVYEIMKAAYEGTCTWEVITSNALVVAVGVCIQYACFGCAGALSHKGAYNTLFRVRCRVVDHLAHAPLGQLDERSTGSIKTVLSDDIEKLELFLAHNITEAIMYLTGPVAAFIFLCSVNVPLALATLVPFAAAFVVMGVIFKRMAGVMPRASAALSRMNAVMVEYVRGMRVIKALNMGSKSFRRFQSAVDEEHAVWCDIARKTGPGFAAFVIIIECGMLVMVPLGGFLFSTGAISGSTFLLFAFVGSLYLTEIRLLQEIGSKYAQVKSGAIKAQELLDLPAFAGGAPFPAKSDVRLENVRFSYDGTREVLHGVNLAVQQGERLAVVGPSGAGKTTIVELVSRFYDATEGTVRIGGVDVRDLDYDDLLAHVAVVFQKTFLTSGSILENIRMGKRATLDEVREAARQARIDDFIMGLPRDYDTEIGTLGERLSGGQRQRIAIARALLHDSPVFVFDEATSSVDVESEELILDTIRELAQSRGKTVIMITHRMANAEHADQVVVLEHGKSVERGAHTELMTADGVYAKLFATQADIENFEEGHARRVLQVGSRKQELSDDSRTEGGAARVSAEAGMTVDHLQSALPTASAGGSEQASAETPAGAANSDSSSKMSTFQVIRRLLKEARPLAGLMAVASTAGTIGHLSSTFLPVFGIIAAFALTGNPVWGMGVAPAVIMMIICALLRGITRYVEQYLNHNVAFHLLALFRSKAFAALRRLAPAKLAGKGKGNLIAMLTTDVELLEIFFAHTISPVAIAVTSTIIYTIVAATLSPWMALALIAAHLVIGILVPRFFATGVHNLGPAIRGAAGKLDNVMLDDMRGLDEIIRFGRGEERAQAIEDRTHALWKDHAKLSKVNGRFTGISGLLVAVLAAALVAVAIACAGANPQSIPALIAAFVLFASSFGPTLALTALPANLTQTFASASRLFGLMDEVPAVTENGTVVPQEYMGMRLDDVTFAYAGEHEVLSDFSLDVPQHGVLGIQGPSGWGKSTMLKLLLRYWDPQHGQVTLSGTPLPEVDVHARRRIQAMMSQETHLFDGSIRDNLLIALPESEVEAANVAGNGEVGAKTVDSRQQRLAAQSAEGDAVQVAASDGLDARLRQALAKASVLDLIDSLPDSLDAQVGELGDRLSEGERQRIGLARVFLRNADLVLFDEPTSRLDALNEAIILRSIHAMAVGEQHADKERGAAVVLVSHRESTMRIADAVLNL